VAFFVPGASVKAFPAVFDLLTDAMLDGEAQATD
jgi:hypothetical protein